MDTVRSLRMLWKNAWVKRAAVIGGIATGLSGISALVHGIETMRDAFAWALWIYERANTPWLGLFILSLVAGMFWYGIKQVAAAAVRGDEAERQEATKRATEEARARVQQQALIETVSERIRSELKDTTELAERFGQLLSMRDAAQRAQRLRRDVDRFGWQIDFDEAHQGYPYDPEMGNLTDTAIGLNHALNTLAVQDTGNTTLPHLTRPVTESVPSDERAAVRLVPDRNHHYFADNRANFEFLRKRADTLAEHYLSAANILERDSSERVKRLNVKSRR
jgi:hypothetical protein